MKTTNAFLLFIILLSIGCDKNEIDSFKELTDGFCIVSNDKVIINHKDIEYYDYSSHLIYLKNSESSVNDIKEKGDFTVYAEGIEIYTGQIVPVPLSVKPFIPVIETQYSLYGDYIIPIGFSPIFDTLYNFVDPDPREDERIVEALKKYDQFHSGLNCEINSFQFSSSNNVKVVLQLSNSDSFDYYYLDPEKMGINLFHYFTNGLILRDSSNKSYAHKITHTQPEPWNGWEKDWLSIIKSNESKFITIEYDNFENVVAGSYKATFLYPGLRFQVDKKDIQQNNGRIWLGELNMIKNINIE